MGAVLIICIFLVYLVSASSRSLLTSLKLRGGALPKAGSVKDDYYDQFTLDYGKEDNSRIAGSLRGFVKSENLASIPHSDLFMKWMCEHLEQGSEALSGRLKPFYVSCKHFKFHS